MKTKFIYLFLFIVTLNACKKVEISEENTQQKQIISSNYSIIDGMLKFSNDAELQILLIKYLN